MFYVFYGILVSQYCGAIKRLAMDMSTLCYRIIPKSVLSDCLKIYTNHLHIRFFLLDWTEWFWGEKTLWGRYHKYINNVSWVSLLSPDRCQRNLSLFFLRRFTSYTTFSLCHIRSLSCAVVWCGDGPGSLIRDSDSDRFSVSYRRWTSPWTQLAPQSRLNRNPARTWT